MSSGDPKNGLKSIISNEVVNYSYHPAFDHIISTYNSIATIALNKPDTSGYIDTDKIYISENSIVQITDFRYTLTDTKGAKSYIFYDKLCFDLDWKDPYKLSYLILDNDLYVFATDDNNNSHRNIRATVKFEDFFGNETSISGKLVMLNNANVYFLDQKHLETKMSFDDSNRINAGTEYDLFKKVADGLITIFKDADKEAETKKIEKGEDSLLDIFKNGFTIDEAVAGYSIPPANKRSKRTVSRP